MLSIAKLFLINEIGPIQPTWTKSSTMNTRGQGFQIRTGRPDPTATVEVEKNRNALRNVPPPKPVNLGMKPSGISS